MIYFFTLCPPLRDMVANMRDIHALRKDEMIVDSAIYQSNAW